MVLVSGLLFTLWIISGSIFTVKGFFNFFCGFPLIFFGGVEMVTICTPFGPSGGVSWPGLLPAYIIYRYATPPRSGQVVQGYHRRNNPGRAIRADLAGASGAAVTIRARLSQPGRVGIPPPVGICCPGLGGGEPFDYQKQEKKVTSKNFQKNQKRIKFYIDNNNPDVLE